MNANLSIATFNIRYDNPDDAQNSFTNRLPFIAKKLKKESPLVVCFQELQPHMLASIEQALPDYNFIGCGREEGFRDERVTIAYNKNFVDILSIETFWLSDTPYIVGSRYDLQSICPRTCVAATLILREEGVAFRVYNTHLDHEEQEARIKGATAIINRMADDNKKCELPILFMGDLNAPPECDEIQLITSQKIVPLEDFTTQYDYTFHGFGDEEAFVKIDYIFGNDLVSLNDVTLWDECNDGIYLSDHYPIAVNITLK